MSFLRSRSAHLALGSDTSPPGLWTATVLLYTAVKRHFGLFDDSLRLSWWFRSATVTSITALVGRMLPFSHHGMYPSGQHMIHAGSLNQVKQTQSALVQVLVCLFVFDNTQHLTNTTALRSQSYCVNNPLTVNRSWGFDEADKYVRYPRCCVYTKVKLPASTQCVVLSSVVSCCVVLWGRLAALEGSSCSGYTSNYGHGACGSRSR